MTGDIECNFKLENGDLALSTCALVSEQRADGSFVAEEVSEKVTFKQSPHNPVKFDAVDVETDVLSPDAALPFVLHRAAEPFTRGTGTVTPRSLSPLNRSLIDAVATTVQRCITYPKCKVV